MTKLDLVLMTADDIPAPAGGEGPLKTMPQSLDGNLEKLERAWPVLMERLRTIVEADDGAEAGGMRVETIQFQIGVEAGFTFGFTGTASAAITVTFARPKPS